MRFIQLFIITLMSFSISFCHPMPGRSRHGDIHHRIHIPTKVRTVYRTKIIKVPEYHHYIHEKGKKEVYYDRLKEVPDKPQHLENDYPAYDEEDYGHHYGQHHFYRKRAHIERYKRLSKVF